MFITKCQGNDYILVIDNDLDFVMLVLRVLSKLLLWLLYYMYEYNTQTNIDGWGIAIHAVVLS